jgi:predicted dehydrogenase
MSSSTTKGPLHRVLVIGVGSIGERHVRCLIQTGRCQVSICETNPQLLKEVGERYEIANQFSHLEAALSTPHDAAVIAVPADLHIRIAQRAVDENLHVFIEKPLSTSLDGIETFMSDVTHSGLVAAVGYVYRAHPALAAMKTAIDTGEFGKPVQIVGVAGQNFPTYRPGYRESYYVDRTRGGGAIQDAMTHLVNAAEWLVGPVDRVVADADHKLIADSQVEDVVNFLARHGHVIGSFSLNQFQAPNELTITIVCERGTARFEYHCNRWLQMRRPEEHWQIAHVVDLERDTLFCRQANSFLDAIEGKAAPICSLQEGLQTLRVNLALQNSIECGAWQTIARADAGNRQST